MIIFDFILGVGVVVLFLLAMAMGLVVTCVIVTIVGIIEFVKWLQKEKENEKANKIRFS